MWPRMLGNAHGSRVTNENATLISNITNDQKVRHESKKESIEKYGEKKVIRAGEDNWHVSKNIEAALVTRISKICVQDSRNIRKQLR